MCFFLSEELQNLFIHRWLGFHFRFIRIPPDSDYLAIMISFYIKHLGAPLQPVSPFVEWAISHSLEFVITRSTAPIFA
jgi:hypothetical protein